MNKAIIVGKIVELSYTGDKCVGILETLRNSGAEDRIPFEVEKDDYLSMLKTMRALIAIRGEVRTRNTVDDSGKNHKEMFVKVTHWNINHDEYNNEVEFQGTLVKKDTLRKTPFGKTIMDVIIAINDNGKSYYPAVILWGSVAERVNNMPVGTDMIVKGRFQSREYQKELPDGNKVTRVAYEISVRTLEEV